MAVSNLLGGNQHASDGTNMAGSILQRFIKNSDSTMCILCGKSGVVLQNSHIFSRAALEAYNAIHCADNNAGGKYILDDRTPKGHDKLTRPLHCGDCERMCSKIEGIFRNVYVQIESFGSPDFRTGEKDVKVESSLLRIGKEDSYVVLLMLGIMLYRGAFVGINYNSIKETSVCNKLDTVLEELRQCCYKALKAIYNCKDKDNYGAVIDEECRNTLQKLRVFLLHNTPFSHYNADLTVTLDFQLHCPSFTVLAVSADDIFLYTKFDCFHVVLPVGDNIPSSFKESVFSPDNFVGDFFYLPRPIAAMHIFPTILLTYNMEEIPRLLELLASITCNNILIVTESFRDYCTVSASGVIIATKQKPYVNDTMLCELEEGVEEHLMTADILPEKSRLKPGEASAIKRILCRNSAWEVKLSNIVTIMTTLAEDKKKSELIQNARKKLFQRLHDPIVQRYQVLVTQERQKNNKKSKSDSKLFMKQKKRMEDLETKLKEEQEKNKKLSKQQKEDLDNQHKEEQGKSKKKGLDQIDGESTALFDNREDNRTFVHLSMDSTSIIHGCDGRQYSNACTENYKHDDILCCSDQDSAPLTQSGPAKATMTSTQNSKFTRSSVGYDRKIRVDRGTNEESPKGIDVS